MGSPSKKMATLSGGGATSSGAAAVASGAFHHGGNFVAFGRGLLGRLS